jgi:5'(3')-deoxyribonucleotidase
VRVFIDMDGVIVDFDRFRIEHDLTGDQVKKLPGAYLAMQPKPLAIAAVRSLIGMGHDVWIATKPPTGIAFAYADKVSWILEHLPELKRKIVITHDKSLLIGEVLIDDRPHKANADKFQGKLLHFSDSFGWSEVLSWFRGSSSSGL